VLLALDKDEKFISEVRHPDAVLVIEQITTAKVTIHNLTASPSGFIPPTSFRVRAKVPDNIFPVVPAPSTPWVDFQVVLPHSIEGGDAWLWHAAPQQKRTIAGGEGPFITTDGSAVLAGRALTVGPDRTQANRTIVVTDHCIPENRATIQIATYWPAQISLDGPVVGLVGEHLHYTVRLIDNHGRDIPVSEFVLIKRESEGTLPDGTTVAFTPDSFDPSRYLLIGPRPEGDSIPVDLSVNFEGLVAKKRVTIYAHPTCKVVGNKTVWAGDDVTFDIAPSTCRASIASVSSSAVTAFVLPSGAIGARANASGNYGISVSLECQGLKLPDTICPLSVWQYFNLDLQLRPTRSPYVGSYVIITPRLNTSNGFQPTTGTVNWTASGPADSVVLFDNTLVLHGYAVGTVVVTAQALEPVKLATAEIYFDYKLKVLTRDLLLPVGTTYQLAVADDLPVTYESLHPAVRVTQTGLVTAIQLGIATVIVRYKSQLSVVGINVTSPAALYLEHVGGTTAVARLLDADGQQYSGRNGSTIAFTPALSYSEDGDRYTLSVPGGPTVVEGAVTAAGVTRDHHVLLHPGIVPWDFAVQRGVILSLTCHAPKPDWDSANLDVILVTDSGEVNARHSGETTVSCAPDIATRATVFELVGLELARINDSAFAVRPLIFSTTKISPDRKLHFAPDLTYKCAWDAPECGETAYTNGTCLLTLKSPRLCPIVSVLKVTAVSRSLNLSVNGTSTIVHNTPWGRTEIRIKLPYGNSTTTPLYGKVRKQDVVLVDEPPKGIEWSIDDARLECLTLKLRATGAYGAETTLTLLDSASREKVRIFISPSGDWAGQVTKDPTEAWLFYLSVILTILSGTYIAIKLGARELLPPGSPYHPRR
jgi:hypothetical protein